MKAARDLARGILRRHKHTCSGRCGCVARAEPGLVSLARQGLWPQLSVAKP